VKRVFYRLRPTYFLSAYIGEVMLAARRVPDVTLLHMRQVYEPPLIPGVLRLRRDIFDPKVGLPRRLVAPEPIVFTKMNVALGATHLAYMMGAARIVYVGVEQRNQLHFYNFDPATKEDLRADLVAQGDPRFLSIDHPYASLAADLQNLDLPLEECMKTVLHELASSPPGSAEGVAQPTASPSTAGTPSSPSTLHLDAGSVPCSVQEGNQVRV
jgi:hypothetical protein